MIDRGTGTPVVMLPGLQGRWEWMAPAVDAVARRCRAITFSLCDEPTSGFPRTRDDGVEAYLAQVEQAMDRAGVADAIVVGISYSGPIAAEFAVRYPDRVRGLVLASALPPGWTLNARARFYMRAPWLLLPLFLLDAPLRAMPEIHAALPRLTDRLRFSLAQANRVVRACVAPTRMAARLRLTAGYPFSDLARITQPVLVVTGEDRLDRVVPAADTRRYVQAIPHARYHVLPRTGHLGSLTKPDEFAELVRQFADGTLTNARRISA